MTSERMNEALAEWAEPPAPTWRKRHIGDPTFSPNGFWFWNGRKWMTAYLPAYNLDDFAHLYPLIEERGLEVQFVDALDLNLSEGPNRAYEIWDMVKATPAQRCEALLRVIGKREE